MSNQSANGHGVNGGGSVWNTLVRRRRHRSKSFTRDDSSCKPFFKYFLPLNRLKNIFCFVLINATVSTAVRLHIKKKLNKVLERDLAFKTISPVGVVCIVHIK